MFEWSQCQPGQCWRNSKPKPPKGRSGPLARAAVRLVDLFRITHVAEHLGVARARVQRLLDRCQMGGALGELADDEWAAPAPGGAGFDAEADDEAPQVVFDDAEGAVKPEEVVRTRGAWAAVGGGGGEL